MTGWTTNKELESVEADMTELVIDKEVQSVEKQSFRFILVRELWQTTSVPPFTTNY